MNDETKRMLLKVDEKGRLFDSTKKQAESKIKAYITMAKNRLDAIEIELLDELNAIFGENPFFNFLTNGNHTQSEIRSILSRDIPRDCEPDSECFNSLLKEIESFKSWKEKMKKEEKKSAVNPFYLVPKNLSAYSTTSDSVSLCWDGVDCECYEIELKTSSIQSVECSLRPTHTFYGLKSGTEYQFRVRAVVHEKDINCIWSNTIMVETSREFNDCAWMKCPEGTWRGYFINITNPRVVTNVGGISCEVIGNVPLPLNKVVSWCINILRLKDRDTNGKIFSNHIIIGIASLDLYENNSNSNQSVWRHWFYTINSPNKIKTGDNVRVTMDTTTTNGMLSYYLNGKNIPLNIAIPLDKPLTPYVCLFGDNDSVELYL